MRSLPLPRLLSLAAGLLLAFGACAAARAGTITTYYLGLSYGTKLPSDPLYAENLFDLFYPEGTCPAMAGCPPTAMPVAVLLHGGNTNAPLSSPQQLSQLGQMLLDEGFVVVVPSFHEISFDQGQDFLTATSDIARLIQYLRYHRVALSIDPARVFCQGHSAGAFHAYYVGLNADFSKPLSRDLVQRESSRPNYLIPWGGSTDWGCFDWTNPATNPLIPFLLFGVPSITQATPEEIAAVSPVYWLQNPWLYDRTRTPPMCLVYNLGIQNPCGTITDVHDGAFGSLMLATLQRACGGAILGQAACEDTTLVDASGTLDATLQAIVEWMAARA